MTVDPTRITPADVQAILGRARAVEGDPRRFAGYRDDPVGFAREVLGVRSLWGKQVGILEGVRDHKKVAVRSGHGVGKSMTFAVLVLWWLYGRQGNVVTTASSWDQVQDVLWNEIRKWWRGAVVPLPAMENHPTLTELRIEPEWWAVGRSVRNPTAIQGRHHTDLLVLIDEAPGIDPDVHEAFNSLVVGQQNRIAMIGNPYESAGRFYDAFRPGSTWHQLHVSSLEHPNVVARREVIPGAVTWEWVEEQRVKWGEDSPVYQASVLGDFPQEGTNAVFGVKAVDRAMDRERYEAARVEALAGKDPVVFGLDVARFGKNRTVLAERRGGVVVELEAWQGLDTVATRERVETRVREVMATGSQVAAVIVDEVGLGGPVLDELQRRGLPAIGFHSGKAARDGVYANRRSELWLRAKRTYVDPDRLRLPANEQLRADLLAPTYRFNASSKLAVERKEELERRGVQSPDLADAVLMSLAAEWDRDPEPVVAPGGADPAAWEPLEDSAIEPFDGLPGWS